MMPDCNRMSQNHCGCVHQDDNKPCMNRSLNSSCKNMCNDCGSKDSYMMNNPQNGMYNYANGSGGMRERRYGSCGSTRSVCTGKCPDTNDHRHFCSYPLAMGYVPWQMFREVYEPEKGFSCGTIFHELNLPFLGNRGCR